MPDQRALGSPADSSLQAEQVEAALDHHPTTDAAKAIPTALTATPVLGAPVTTEKATETGKQDGE